MSEYYLRWNGWVWTYLPSGEVHYITCFHGVGPAHPGYKKNQKNAFEFIEALNRRNHKIKHS
jgi:hypothetical protein